MLKLHPYSILTGDTMVEFVIFCVLSLSTGYFIYIWLNLWTFWEKNRFEIAGLQKLYIPMRLHKGLGFIESITKTFSFLSYFADKCQISLAKATFLFSENTSLQSNYVTRRQKHYNLMRQPTAIFSLKTPHNKSMLGLYLNKRNICLNRKW